MPGSRIGPVATVRRPVVVTVAVAAVSLVAAAVSPVTPAVAAPAWHPPQPQHQQPVPGHAAAIELSEHARRSGVPAAPIVSTRDGDVIDTSTSMAVSVWEWMPGQVVTTAMTSEQHVEAGHALGRIHALFAALPESAGPAPAIEAWRAVRVAKLESSIDILLGRIAERTAAGVADAFDADAEQTLHERRAMLPRLTELLADLPTSLTSQVLHGDYSPMNLLFADDQLTAVVDFRPPTPFLLAYDAGRIAFYPNTVTMDDQWQSHARALIAAYREVNPSATEVDIRACGRVALLQLLGSLYGVKQHYVAPSLFQDDLDAFWLMRHRAVTVLLDHLVETDELLADIAAAPAG